MGYSTKTQDEVSKQENSLNQNNIVRRARPKAAFNTHILIRHLKFMSSSSQIQC